MNLRTSPAAAPADRGRAAPRWGVWAAWLLVVLAAPARATEIGELAGAWRGEAAVIVVWCEQRSLPVSLEIAPDGSVSGQVGDAKIVRGTLRPGRGWLGRTLHLGTDYRIDAELTGPLVAAEGIARARVSLPLNRADDTLRGGVASSGLKVGGKDRMVFTAANLTLRRVSNPSSLNPSTTDPTHSR